jgi:hypothetical protein
MTGFDDIRDRVDEVEQRLADDREQRPELTLEEKQALAEAFDVDPWEENSERTQEIMAALYDYTEDN